MACALALAAALAGCAAPAPPAATPAGEGTGTSAPSQTAATPQGGGTLGAPAPVQLQGTDAEARYLESLRTLLAQRGTAADEVARAHPDQRVEAYANDLPRARESLALLRSQTPPPSLAEVHHTGLLWLTAVTEQYQAGIDCRDGAPERCVQEGQYAQVAAQLLQNLAAAMPK